MKQRLEEWLLPKQLSLIAGWAADGLTNADIAHNIGIAERTFYDWVKRSPQLSQTLKTGKSEADFIVENALFRRATGFASVEERTERRNGNEVVTIVKKIVPPDTTACIYWLKNRRPDKWRDKQREDDTTDMEDAAAYFEAAGLTEEEE